MAQLLSSNVSGNLIVSQNTTISGNLIVSGYNVLNEIFQADNLARVSANSGSTQSAVALNFVNTATVTVSVTSGGSGVANIGFTSTATGSGTVTSVDTGTGLTGGPITSSGTISANIANTTIQGVTKLVDSVTSTDAANAATAASVKTSYDQATLGYGQANAAIAQANTARDQANVAYSTANNSANATRVSANSGPAVSNVSLNFVNTATVQVSVTSGAAGVANIAFISTSGGTGTVTQVNSGLGLTGGPITSSGTLSANIANTTIQGITKLIDVVTSTDSGNAATGAAVKTAYDQATTAYGQANAAIAQANTARDQANAAFTTANTSANTVQVSANSGSTFNKVSLNFVNTATIQVSVGSGTGSNANIAFSYIGAVGGGGGGINNFPVSANSGSTVTANGLNFVNSSSILVSVGSGTTGNANITLTATNIADNVKIVSGATRSSNIAMFSDGRVTEWSHLQNGKFFDIVEATPQGVFAKPDGTTIYVVGQTLDNVYQYSLSTAWNVATATLSQIHSVTAQETLPVDLFFKSDGSVLYLLGDQGNDITYYSLSESWNVGSTITLDGTYSLSAQTTTPSGLHFSGDGTKFWVSSVTTVFQYTVATPWTLTTASYDNKSFTNPQDTTLKSVSLDPSGTTMFLLGDTNDRVYEYYLTTANDITTAVYSGRSSYIAHKSTQIGNENTFGGMYIAYPNNKMYLLGTASDTILEYNLDNGLSIDANSLGVTGQLTVGDNLYVEGDMNLAGALQIGSTLDVAATIAVLGSATFTGSGTNFTFSGTTASFGNATTNTTYSFGNASTAAARIKEINVGTGGVAGSITNITIGPVGVSSNVNINANTAVFSNSVNIQNQLIVSGVDIINQLAIAENTVRVSANSGATLSNKYLNFVNTATVTVSVTDAGDGNANIAFTSSGSSGVTSVGTGLGLTGGPITSTGTISANIASTTVQGITKLIDSVTSTDAANAATGAAVKTAYDQATSAYGRANTANTTAVSAYGQANLAYTQANAAYTAANSAANTTRVSANSSSTQSAVGINFINTSTVIVSVGAGVAGTANVGFTVNTSKIIFVGTTAPSSPAIGDLWVDTN